MERAKHFGFKSKIKRVCVKRDTEANRIRSTAAWQKLRRLKRKGNPMCEDPFNVHYRDGISVGMYEAHHIEPLAVAPEKAYDIDNLMSLCRACHERIEA